LLRPRAKRIYSAYGVDLVRDGTYYASRSHYVYGAWDFDKYPRGNKAAWIRRLVAMPRSRLATLASPGPCHDTFPHDLPAWIDGDDDRDFGYGDASPTAPKIVPIPIRDGGKPQKPSKRRKREATTMFFGRRVLLVLDAASGLPVIIVVRPANMGEREVFLKDVLPELRRLDQ
jgi:hypothetical protein